MERIKAFVNNFNLLTWPKAMVEWLLCFPRVEPIVIDNSSDWPPLLEWYKTCPVEVVRLKRNLGHLAPWQSGTVQIQCPPGKPYIVTDPDLDLSGIPDDWLERMEHGLAIFSAERPVIYKCGFSLRIDDLPANQDSENTKTGQQPFHVTEVEPGYFLAATDTTFSLYRPGFGRRPLTPCLRLAAPYQVRHLPWYFTADSVTVEYRHYIDTANSSAQTASYLRRSLTKT